MNDKEIMQELIDASRAGAEVLLLVRGICCLRPGVPGETEHITVRSIIGRYLEHERIYAFGRGGETRVWFGSGDLLERNTMRRVEAFVEAKTPNVKEELLALIEFLQLDDRKVWTMQPDGTYARPETPGHFISQAALRDYFAGRTVAKPEAVRTKEAGSERAIRESPLQLAVVEPPEKKKSLWQRFLDWLRSN